MAPESVKSAPKQAPQKSVAMQILTAILVTGGIIGGLFLLFVIYVVLAIKSSC